MKKHLLTAALAIVAVGGVFAMNVNTNTVNKTLAPWTYTDGSGCHEISELPPGCGTGNFTCLVNGAQVRNGTCAAPGLLVQSTIEP